MLAGYSDRQRRIDGADTGSRSVIDEQDERGRARRVPLGHQARWNLRRTPAQVYRKVFAFVFV